MKQLDLAVLASSSTSEASACTNQHFVVNLLPDELVFAEGVASLSRDGIDGSLLHLLFDGTVEHEEWFPSTLLQHRGWRRRRERGEKVPSTTFASQDCKEGGTW